MPDRGVGAGSIARLVCALAVAGAGLIAVLPQPTNVVWHASIALSEAGQWLAILSLLLLPGWRRSWVDTVGSFAASVGIALLLSPLVRAYDANDVLPAALTSAFGERVDSSPTGATPRPAPLVLRDLFLGVPAVDAAADVIIDEHVYTVVEGEQLSLDLYRPPHAEGSLPVIVIIHGGGWTSGNRREFPDLNEYLAAQGYVVASPSYRLAPRWQFPAAQSDIAAAIRYVKDLEHTHSLDPTRIALVGRSAGAQIAVLTAYTSGDLAIKGVVSFYGPFGLRWGYANPAKPGVVDSSGLLETYLGGPPHTHGARYDAAEPFRFITAATPPTLFIQGLRDEHVSPFHAELVSARLLDADRPHHVLRMPWATHSCDYFFSGPCGQISTYAVEHFLSTVLRDAE